MVNKFKNTKTIYTLYIHISILLHIPTCIIFKLLNNYCHIIIYIYILSYILLLLSYSTVTKCMFLSYTVTKE